MIILLVMFQPIKRLPKLMIVGFSSGTKDGEMEDNQ